MHKGKPVHTQHSHMRTFSYCDFYLWIPGGRTADDIVRWLLKRTGPPATELTEVEQAKKFSEGGDVVVIGFFEDKESEEAKAFITAADNYDDLPFGITSVKEVAEALEAQMNTIVVFKKVWSCGIYKGVCITLHTEVFEVREFRRIYSYKDYSKKLILESLPVSRSL